MILSDRYLIVRDGKLKLLIKPARRNAIGEYLHDCFYYTTY